MSLVSVADGTTV